MSSTAVTCSQPAAPARALPRPVRGRVRKPLCAACQAREARYGFQDQDDPTLERPRTLCFECFRMEIDRRQAIAAREAHGARSITWLNPALLD